MKYSYQNAIVDFGPFIRMLFMIFTFLNILLIITDVECMQKKEGKEDTPKSDFSIQNQNPAWQNIHFGTIDYSSFAQIHGTEKIRKDENAKSNEKSEKKLSYLQVLNTGNQKEEKIASSSSGSSRSTSRGGAAQKHQSKMDFSTRIQGNEQHNKYVTVGIETKSYSMGRHINLLMIRMINDRNGNKWIHICQKPPFDNYDLPNISVPKDAFLLVKAMDSLMGELADHHQENNPFYATKWVKGSHSYDYKLGINLNKYSQLQFLIKTIHKDTQKKILLPIRLLPFLRERMVKILAELQIEPPPTLSSSLPKWMLEADLNKKAKELFYRDKLDYSKVDDNDKLRDRKIQIEYERGESGINFIYIQQRFDKEPAEIKNDNDDKYQYIHFANIHILDLPPLLDEMRTMSNELKKQLQPPIDQNHPSMICHQFVKGINYDYKLEIHSRGNQQLNFELQTFPNENKLHIPIKLNGPIDIFYWLQDQMAEILMISSSSHHKLCQHVAADEQGTELAIFPKEKLESNSLKSRTDIIETLHVDKIEYVSSTNETNTLLIEMNQSKKNKRKWILLRTRLFFTDHKFAQISVPEDAYSFINGMDELMSKIVEHDKPPNYPIFVRNIKGLIYDYRLGIGPYNGQLQFRMESITIAAFPFHKPKQLYFPIHMLHSFRERMAKLLVEFDGTQIIGPPPSPLPKWMEEEIKSKDVIIDDQINKDQWELLRKETFDFNVNIYNEKQDKQITIKLQRNKRGDEFIEIVEKFDIGEDNCLYFPPIPMPMDAHRLLDAMHALSNDLQKKCPNFQIPDDIPLGTLICRQITKGGLLYDYKLEIVISPISIQLNFRLETITIEANKLHNSKKLYGPIPLDVFNWLKEKIAELLKSSSSNQQEEEQQGFKNDNEKGHTFYKEKANKFNDGLIRRVSKFYWLEAESRPRLIKIEFKQGKSGRKYINIGQKYEKNIAKEGDDVHYINFPNILVPEDAYPFLNAMKAMSNELQEKRNNGTNQQSSMICQQLVKGILYDYKLEIHSCQNQKLDFRLKTMTNKTHKWNKPKELLGPIPIHIFNWLREKMAEILDDYEEFVRNEEK